MAKITLNDVTNGYSAAVRINANNDLIEAAIEKTLSRDGTTPNQMESDLDMNGYHIKNLGSPVSATDAARLVDITGLITLTGIPIPSLVGNANKLLFTDGSGIFWGDLPLAALPLFTSVLKGAVPASGGNSAHVLHADGTWHTPAYPTNFNAPIQFQDEGANLGASGSATIVNFVGDLVSAARVGSTVTVTINAAGGGGGDPDSLTLSANESNVRVWQRMGSPGGAGPFTITVAAGVDITSLSPSVPAMDFTGFSASATVNLVNNGRIMGCGGSGGDGGFAQDTSDGGELIKFPRAGTSGGDAIKGPGAGVTFSITNAQGRIYGGGGGGGGGGLSHTDNSTSHAVGGGGGGGAGGGRAGRGDKVGDQFNSATSTDGGNGTFVDAAAGGTGGTGGEQGGSDDGGNGGAGGDWGANGTIGDSPTGADIDITGGSAGLAGKAINQAGGTASFVSGSGSPNVKGAVT
jgi:hypothetical protein